MYVSHDRHTIFEEVYQAAPASWDIQAVRDLLGRFLFSGDDQFKSVATLSGGERRRVALAKLLLRPNNLLLLDEPTAGVDVATRRDLAALRRPVRAGHPQAQRHRHRSATGVVQRDRTGQRLVVGVRGGHHAERDRGRRRVRLGSGCDGAEEQPAWASAAVATP